MLWREMERWSGITAAFPARGIRVRKTRPDLTDGGGLGVTSACPATFGRAATPAIVIVARRTPRLSVHTGSVSATTTRG